ncbi:MAG: hypothetical protein WDO17_20915 [Alphaproteobacteria bacterium]
MKLITTLLSAALVAGASTIAIAQSAGGSGGADSTTNPYQMGRGIDANPSGMLADPMAGNHGNTPQAQAGQWTTNGQWMNGMNSSNVSGQWDRGQRMSGQRTNGMNSSDVSGQRMTRGQRMNGMNSSNVSGQWNDGSWNGSRSNRSGW